MTRRAFFERSGRWASGLILSILGGFIVLQREIAPPANCGEDGVCRQCLKNKRCGKPAARQWRMEMDR